MWSPFIDAVNSTENVGELIQMEKFIQQRIAYLCIQRQCQNCAQCGRPKPENLNPTPSCCPAKKD